MCAALYAPGILFYAWARFETERRLFHPVEVAIAIVLGALGLYAAYQMWTGAISAL
ncbi:hypothetical protein LJR098_002698 [Rhizobium sp. LjRoot98]